MAERSTSWLNSVNSVLALPFFQRFFFPICHFWLNFHTTEVIQNDYKTLVFLSLFTLHFIFTPTHSNSNSNCSKWQLQDELLSQSLHFQSTCQPLPMLQTWLLPLLTTLLALSNQSPLRTVQEVLAFHLAEDKQGTELRRLLSLNRAKLWLPSLSTTTLQSRFCSWKTLMPLLSVCSKIKAMKSRKSRMLSERKSWSRDWERELSRLSVSGAKPRLQRESSLKFPL